MPHTSSPPTPIFLAGMMGTGKSHTGRLLARRLDRPFIDLDAQIETETATPIPELFATQGEAAFRTLEAQTLETILSSSPSPLVLALGGGTVLDPSLRTRLQSAGTLICLTATPTTLAIRLLPELAARPLLADLAPPQPRPADPGAPTTSDVDLPQIDHLSLRLAQLLSSRQPAYDSIPLQVSTDHRDPEAVADAILTLLSHPPPPGLRCLAIHRPTAPTDPRFGYSVLIGPGLLASLGPRLAAAGHPGPILLVSDENVAPLHAETALSSLRAAGLESQLVTFPAGEAAKTLATVHQLYDALLSARLDRTGTLVALGGGVVGDTAGLAAATYLRGIRLVQAPTSLLAMVDASIGGKVGVNLPEGKNLVGAFHHPDLVLADTSTLSTLPPRHLRAGLAEVVKSALISDPDLLPLLESISPSTLAQPDSPHTAELISRSISVKADLVRRDPHEQGPRALLNLGHTFAHAIEQASDYTYLHGEAVAIGLWAAAELARRQALLHPSHSTLPTRLASLLTHLGLPTRCPNLDPSALLAAMSHDKKRHHGRLRLVLPHAPGDIHLHPDIPPSTLPPLLATLTAAP